MTKAVKDPVRLCILTPLTCLAVVYKEEITKDLLKIWDLVLSDCSDEHITKAFTAYARGDNAFFPKPGQIYSLIYPKEELEQEAALITERMISLISLCGGSSEFNQNRAKIRIGEVGWHYIQKFRGGWPQFCASFSDDSQLDIAKSQIRKALTGLLKQKRSSNDSLENKTTTRSLQDFGFEIKNVPRNAISESDFFKKPEPE